ncbi:MAG: YbhB/YbcL family Raf kinase inhibitor-like protein [Patescibacteria group bacterium]
MRLNSPEFKNGELIPPLYTCDGEDVNPELHLHDVPKLAVSLALIVDDPESPSGNWLHWCIWNIDVATKIIERDSVPLGAVEGETDFSEVGYGGPCPSFGEHEYRFTIYALDIKLDLVSGAPRHAVDEAMVGHIISETALFGRYQRISKEERADLKAKIKKMKRV